MPILFTFETWGTGKWKENKWFKFGNYAALSLNDKMPIIIEDHEQYVICNDCEPEL